MNKRDFYVYANPQGEIRKIVDNDKAAMFLNRLFVRSLNNDTMTDYETGTKGWVSMTHDEWSFELGITKRSVRRTVAYCRDNNYIQDTEIGKKSGGKKMFYRVHPDVMIKIINQLHFALKNGERIRHKSTMTVPEWVDINNEPRVRQRALGTPPRVRQRALEGGPESASGLSIKSKYYLNVKNINVCHAPEFHSVRKAKKFLKNLERKNLAEINLEKISLESDSNLEKIFKRHFSGGFGNLLTPPTPPAAGAGCATIEKERTKEVKVEEERRGQKAIKKKTGKTFDQIVRERSNRPRAEIRSIKTFELFWKQTYGEIMEEYCLDWSGKEQGMAKSVMNKIKSAPPEYKLEEMVPKVMRQWRDFVDYVHLQTGAKANPQYPCIKFISGVPREWMQWHKTQKKPKQAKNKKSRSGAMTIEEHMQKQGK